MSILVEAAQAVGGCTRIEEIASVSTSVSQKIKGTFGMVAST